MPATPSSSVLDRPPKAPKPIFGEPASRTEIITIRAFLIIPFIALLAAIPLMWGWGVSWVDLTVAAVFYTVSTLGVTVGFHRYFTHGAFKAARPLRIALAIAGMLAAQGSVLGWVADHRRHHAFSDREGDPHSPWLFGTSPKAILRGFWHAHMGWLFGRDRTNIDRFAPDLAEDRDIRMLDKLFPLWVTLSVALPAVIGGLVTMSWWGALTGFLWAGLARVAFQHHVTWSTNSICHMIGSRPFASRDRSANFWPLAILSMGESWHNSHHADPTSARHGVLRGQIDISARLIWIFEKLGWVSQVRWPTQERLDKLAVSK
ncbi:stearoyl-CoA desaturase (delta-9 desaturase) [Actinokineospora alba]|uniref:Stearoyl-CoA desaturase (Delta-9 desaturase) n=1 Tax=Actinokineospora alba TaxID=504798 RepID=A0A1H0IBU9_9PSEU|nr:acyl-CoA desaturase [Actinokineospora alba]TDP71007.1 stearoyl-CoA desaturase (delta-9 desaturase) [Actinokineospora alba]SDI88147.1 stearoyl-CoA desaturase (delta-9 desaturase) [Actinokineospora alba]SDO28835.1 stearoyl-CoA desaturase (delta-9 desaturase) [Actinokineospora alba]